MRRRLLTPLREMLVHAHGAAGRAYALSRQLAKAFFNMLAGTKRLVAARSAHLCVAGDLHVLDELLATVREEAVVVVNQLAQLGRNAVYTIQLVRSSTAAACFPNPGHRLARTSRQDVQRCLLFLQAVREHNAVRALYWVLGVVYGAWRQRRQQPAPAWERAVCRAFAHHARRYGTHCVRAELQATGWQVSRYRIRRVLHLCSLRA